MTEYWVSQGNKWCDFCKIYIANNPLSIRTHELGKRHKDNVAARLATMRKESAAKEKEKKDATKALEQIEVKAQLSYQKDLVAFKEAKISGQLASDSFQKDSNTSQFSEDSKGKAPLASDTSVGATKGQGQPSGLVLAKSQASLYSTRSVKPSSIAMNKRKRDDGKPKTATKEEVAALKAREAARKRVEEREKHLLGLYQSY